MRSAVTFPNAPAKPKGGNENEYEYPEEFD